MSNLIKNSIIIVIIISILIFIIGIFLQFSKQPKETLKPQPGVDISTPFNVDETLQQIKLDVEMPKDDTDIPNRNDRIVNLKEEEVGLKSKDKFKYDIITRIFKGKTAGYKIIQEDGLSKIRIVEKGIGNRWEITLLPYGIKKVGGGEFLKVKEAYIFDNGKTLILYENSETLETLSAIVDFDTTLTSADPIVFEKNIKVSSNNKNSFAYLKEINKKIEGFIVNLETNTTKKIWSSGGGGWNLHWEENPYVTIFTPISRTLNSHVYITQNNTKNISKINEGLSYGFIPFANTDYSLEYKLDADNQQSLFFYKQNEKNSFSVGNTLPEKCDGYRNIFICGVPKNISSRTRSGYPTVFPDSWYEGDLVLDDDIFIIDPETQDVDILISTDRQSIKELIGDTAFDVISPSILPSGEYFLFVNKNDSSLWLVSLVD